MTVLSGTCVSSTPRGVLVLAVKFSDNLSPVQGVSLVTLLILCCLQVEDSQMEEVPAGAVVPQTGRP